jgi:RNase P subunit RPR2
MTPKLRQPESKAFHCQHCKHILGRTDGARLYVADCAFPFVVTIICQVCNGITKWKPLIRAVETLPPIRD